MSAAATTTSTEAPVTSTTSPAATTSTSITDGAETSTPPDPVAAEPPQIILKEPGDFRVLPADEVADYFIFSFDVSPSHTTTYTASGPDETFAVTARTDGESTHYLDPSGREGEMITSSGDVWVREGGGEWALDDEMSELPYFVSFPTPEFAYAVAYIVFDELDFAGWISEDGEDLAVYLGGASASARVLEGLGQDVPADHDGRVEVWWSPAGYFAKVGVELTTASTTFSMDWLVTDVGTTEVEVPDWPHRK